jgi:hypothetical protein
VDIGERLMAGVTVTYVPNLGAGSGLAELLIGSGMREFMNTAGAQGETIARGYSSTPSAISSEVVQAFSRWTANVINGSQDSLVQEYGTPYLAPLAPLGHVIEMFREADTKRKKPLLTRLYSQ